MEKERIINYWSERSHEFVDLRTEEQNSEMGRKWLSEIEKNLPKGRKLKILDVGTGTGFFALMLSARGHQVMGIDLTDHMIYHARELAKEQKSSAEFFVMDAEKPEFPDATFDVVVSRNLTWNLPHPEMAYKEWLRVLKKGGKLLNFDANWYGYLYDDKKREAYENDRKNVEKGSLDDHYLCTDIDRMEKIAMQVPLSETKRPGWDVKVLEALGAAQIQVNEDIWQQVWSEEEKLNYGSTPMFMVEAVK